MIHERENYAGFTLGEMLVAMAIIAIVLAVGVPAYQDTIAENRLTTSTNQLIASLNVARSEAVKRGGELCVCGSGDLADCDGDWTAGWIVFTDGGVAGGVDGTDEILRVWAPSGGSVAVTANFATSDSVRFQSDGREADDDTGTFSFCDDRAGETMRQIAVARSGRIQLVDNPGLCP